MDKVIHCTAHLHCTPQQAYDYFATKVLLEAWLAPVAEVEPRVGGRYELFWDPADRANDSTIGCKVTAVEPGSLLAFEWKSPRQFKHFANGADPLTHCVVTFHTSESGAKVHLIHSGWRSTTEWVEAAEWQIQAWTHAFQALEKHVNEP